jgi:LysR family glycine cleavage system transcriptional activator
MSIDWRSMPSLTALRAFEAAARLGGFSPAARNLNVTHAAIAQQVRALEAELGVALLRRDGKAVALTGEGTRLAAALAEGFGSIQSAVAALKSGEVGPVRITLTAAFAAHWLMPRLRDFWARHPDVPLSLHPDPRPVDLRRERMDLVIRYGRGDWPGVTARRLTSARLVVVGAPGLLEGRLPSAGEMQHLPWVLTEGWPEQDDWLRSQGLEPATLRASVFPDEDLSIAACREGLGLMVESHALVEADLRASTSVPARDGQESLPAYFVVTPDGPARKAARVFLSWLARQA